MNAFLLDRTVCPEPIPGDVAPHRGLVLSVLERGSIGYTMRGEIDYNRELEPVRVGIPHVAFELWLPMLKAAVALVETMQTPVDPVIAQNAELIAKERLRLADEGGVRQP